MFEKVDVPVLGFVENMSWFRCAHCGERTEVFGHGGARREAERLGVDFLGEIPLAPRIRETSDSGAPLIAVDPSGTEAAVFEDIAARVAVKIEQALAAAEESAPRIVIR